MLANVDEFLPGPIRLMVVLRAINTECWVLLGRRAAPLGVLFKSDCLRYGSSKGLFRLRLDLGIAEHVPERCR